MITTYLDKNCKTLESTQNLKLEDGCSALWFCADKGSDFSRYLQLLVSSFDSLTGYVWLAFSGGVGSSKMLDIKRAFGHWSVPRGDVVYTSDSLDEYDNKLYSDVAKINDERLDAITSIIKRDLFGIDSSLFFLPKGSSLASTNVAKPLADLLVKRNSMGIVDAEKLNQGLLEEHISIIVSMNGIATVTLRDSNMATIVVAVGNHFTLSRVAKLMEANSSKEGRNNIVSDNEFSRLIEIGVSVSVFS